MMANRLLIYVLTLIYFDSSALAAGQGCIKVKDCPAAISHIKNIKNDDKSIRYLQEAHCGFDGNEPIVRCSSIPDISVVIPQPKCIPLEECSSALQLMRTRMFDPAVVNLLRSVHCGETKNQPLVLCEKINFG